MKNLIGIDVGGTKCAVVVARGTDDGTPPQILSKKSFPTIAGKPRETIDTLVKLSLETLAELGLKSSDISAIGVSCGGPLDSTRGVVISPPNLAGWDNIPITEILENRLGAPAFLQNDANACALAEWLYGAGKGARNMVFMTFGTGLGAGLILDGKLYAGTNDNAGEVGHIRLENFGPVGYAKAGSFARTKATELLQRGENCAYCKSAEDLPNVSAKTVAIAADGGDKTAREVYAISGRKLGAGISLLIDILNPELVVIGSIFARSENLLRPEMQRVIDAEALSGAAAKCRVVPALLGESIGDIAALSVAANGLKNK